MQQNSYRFIHEFARITKYNPEYIAIYKDLFSKYNKTSGAWNVMGAIKKDLNSDIMVSYNNKRKNIITVFILLLWAYTTVGQCTGVYISKQRV